MSIMEVALKLAERNKPVFPCSPENKWPLTPHGFKDASCKSSQITAWWNQYKNAMIGVPTGKISDFWAVDCDGQEGIDAFGILCQQHGYTPDTLCQATPSGGCHYIYKYPGQPIKNSVCKLADKVDVRGDGGYIILAPSEKSDGGKYKWKEMKDPQPAPDWLLALVCKSENTPSNRQDGNLLSSHNGKNAYVNAAINDECAKVANAPKGTRNQTLFQSACALFQLVASGNADEQIVQSSLERAAKESCLANDDGQISVLKTIASGKKAGMASPRKIPESSHRQLEANNPKSADTDRQEWPEPVPFEDFDLPRPDITNLPPVLSEFCQAASESLQVPTELPLAMSLAAVATCVQGKFVTQVKPDYIEPVNIYMFCPLEPGNRKSGTVSACVTPINDYEKMLHREARDNFKREASERKTLEKVIESKRNKAASASPDNLKQIMAEIADIEATLPDVQPLPRLMVDNVTPEALAVLLAYNNERLGLIEAEGGIFDIISGMYNGGTVNLDLFLKSYSMEPVRIDRKNSEPVCLRNPCLTIGLCPQICCLTDRKASTAFRGRGLDARFLYLLPKSLLGKRKIETESIPNAVKNHYHEALTNLLTLQPCSWPDDDWKPFVLHLSKESYRLWVDFAKAVESELGGGGTLEHMKDWGGKLPGGIVRVASLFHILNQPYPQTENIGRQSMEQAISLGHIFIDHARAAYALMGTDEKLEAAKKILGWLQRTKMQSFRENECWQGLRGSFKHMEQVRNGLSVLQERFYISELATDTVSRRGRPLGQAYMVSPRVYS